MELKRKGKLGKKLLTGMVALSMMLSAAGCSAGGPPEGVNTGSGGGTIAVFCKAQGVEFWDHVKIGAEDACDELGYELEYYCTENDTDIDGQIEMVRQAILNKVDAIVIAPNSSNDLNEVLGEATQANIPIITINSDVSFRKRKAYIGSSNQDAGAVAGRQVAQLLQEAGGGQIGIIGHVEGAQTAVQRIKGFRDTITTLGQNALDSKAAEARTALDELSNTLTSAEAELASAVASNDAATEAELKAAIEQARAGQETARKTLEAILATPNPFSFVAEEYCSNNRDRAKEIALKMINDYPDMKYIFTTNENSTLGACDAVNELRNGMGTDVQVVGFNSNTQEITYLMDDILVGTVVQAPYNMGYLGVRYAAKLLDGDKIVENLDTGCTYVTNDNLNDSQIQLLLDPKNYGKTDSSTAAQ